MSWFKKLTTKINTSTREKKEVPDGLWFKCPDCSATVPNKDLQENFFKCPSCNHHSRIGSGAYFSILFDTPRFKELFSGLRPKDFQGFEDMKPYSKRIEQSQSKTQLKDAMRVAQGKVNGEKLVVACMDFSFIGGSMGSVVGEKISRSVDYCLEKKYPLLIISKSGGARMMESGISLMQMAKTSVKLAQLGEAKLPYISLMTDPTTGGVTASYAMLGDFNIAEPKALIGFAGPRVIKETIKRDLPEGFQRSEFLLEHGFLDFIVDRSDLKARISDILSLMKK